MLNRETIQKCIGARKVFILGNSVARQFAYHLSNSTVPSRADQKQLCPKHDLGGKGKTCIVKADFTDIISSW